MMTSLLWRHVKIGMLLLLLCCASACGQKGDLYLPSEEEKETENNSA